MGAGWTRTARHAHPQGGIRCQSMWRLSGLAGDDEGLHWYQAADDPLARLKY